MVFRIRHRTVPPDSLPARGLPTATTPIPILFPASAVYFCVCQLLCDLAMAANWIVGEEGFAVVYFGGSEYLVD